MRLKLKCKLCDKSIGYISLPDRIIDNSNGILHSTVDTYTDENSPICCIDCEVVRNEC